MCKMEIEKIFNGLESNQVQEWDDAKQKLVDLFIQNKEQWVAQYMMEYFLRTGSLRIMEVLVRAQSPHDIYIFDRLDDWLKTIQFRVQALNLFSFIVRKHPTWLFKVEKHRLIKTIIKLLMNEKEIVPLMSALLCIITLLPIIPSLVPNFLNDLFEIFGHLAAWNAQNQNRLPEDKLVHLQLGLQMLFHRLYGMFPCNFLSYLSDFIRKERGAVFQHTIQPLLETVRVHPLLVTATVETEVSHARWKEKEPHDVVMDCVRVSLPAVYQDYSAEYTQTITSARSTPGISYTRSSSYNAATKKENFAYEIRDVYQRLGPISRFDGGGIELVRANALWSPFNEISTHTPMPLTPTPSYRLSLTATPNIHTHHLTPGENSPPETAVEATPETTPLKVVSELKQNDNPLAVRTLFATASEATHRPLPKTPVSSKSSLSNFDVVAAEPISAINIVEQETRYSRRIQQVIQERTQSQSPFQTIEALNAKRSLRSSLTPASELNTASPTPQGMQTSYTPTSTSMSTPMATPAPTTPMDIHKICDDCNETTDSLCTAGGLHTPTSRSIELMAKGIKRRSRFISYCCNEANHKLHNESQLHVALRDGSKIRRTKSCECMNVQEKLEDKTLTPTNFTTERRLQKSNKMLSIAKATKKIIASKIPMHAATQTVETDAHNYEHLLFSILQQTNEKRSEYERHRFARNPQEIFNRYVNSCWVRDSFDNVSGTYRIDQEQYQLVCLQLQYERYRREIHAERNRRLMGRSRERRSLEMERDRLREQFKNIAINDKELITQIDNVMLEANEKEKVYINEINALKRKYQHEVDQNKCLRQANENLEQSLNEEILKNRELNNEIELLRSEMFNMGSELVNAQQQAEIGMLCKQELARLESEFIIMGEVQVKCRDRLLEMENLEARSGEMQMLQNAYNAETKDIRTLLEERTYQLDGAKHRLVELQMQVGNCEKVITDQKRLLKAVKDEYEEKFKAVNRKYDVQKTIILKMEERLVMALNKPPVSNSGPQQISPDDFGEHNSPLSTSLASSESLSASLRSTAHELLNLENLVEPDATDASHLFENPTGSNAATSSRNIKEQTKRQKR